MNKNLEEIEKELLEKEKEYDLLARKQQMDLKLESLKSGAITNQAMQAREVAEKLIDDKKFNFFNKKPKKEEVVDIKNYKVDNPKDSVPAKIAASEVVKEIKKSRLFSIISILGYFVLTALSVMGYKWAMGGFVLFFTITLVSILMGVKQEKYLINKYKI